MAAILCLVFAVLFWLFYHKQLKWPYIILSLISAIFAAYAVYGGFSQDPSLWSSESWRWAGIILNGMGALAGLAAVKGALKWV
jgi:multisubunit Na+/H+ antiporter MnhE subunit